MSRCFPWSVLLLCLIALSGAGRSALADPKPADAPQPHITIDAAATREPMSKYIYSQFIEHLGRCIYGGIWAEMLEDRKFFDPVGAKQSPWKAMGPAEGVTMDRQHPFVGEHTPKVALAGDGKPAGIVQGDLALRKGKPYVGRIWLLASEKAGPVSVSLVWGNGPNDRQTMQISNLNGQYTQMLLRFLANGVTDHGRLEIAAAGSGHFQVGTVSLMPADNVHGMRADTLALLRQLDSPLYRWPGGNFVSGYNFKDGLGDPDRRPPRKNPAWKGIEHNDFGLNEFMTFCRLIGTEPYVAVNSGQGDVGLAVDEVQYANGTAQTPMGKLRTQHGYPRPYGVKWWSVGNEMFGNWQLGHMPLEDYIKKHNQFAAAMRAEDPSIKLIAVGNVGTWSEGMMQHCADQMDLVSEHFYSHQKPELAEHVRQAREAIRHIADTHRDYRRQFDSLKGKDIRIAVDEWNYWYGEHLYGELGTRYFLKDALGIAAGLNEFARQSDMIYMANYAQTVNVIGCIKTTKTDAAFESTGLALMLYRQHFGVLPVAVEATPPLDVAAAWSADRKSLTVAVVNPTLKRLDLPLELKGAKLRGAGHRWQIAGNDPLAFNTPGKTPNIRIEEAAMQGVGNHLTVEPCSVTLFSLVAE
jgi:alpha-L-arabinofuranosidase